MTRAVEEERRAQLNQVRGADTRTMSAVVPPNRSLSKGQAAPQRRNRRYSAENNIDASSLATYFVTEFRTALMLAASGHSRRDIELHLKTALGVLG